MSGSRNVRLAFGTFILRRQLDSATTAYNQAVGSFEGRVLPQLRRIEQLDGMAPAEPVAEPPAIDTAARRMREPVAPLRAIGD